jgi:hypothetical protein
LVRRLLRGEALNAVWRESQVLAHELWHGSRPGAAQDVAHGCRHRRVDLAVLAATPASSALSRHDNSLRAPLFIVDEVD